MPATVQDCKHDDLVGRFDEKDAVRESPQQCPACAPVNRREHDGCPLRRGEDGIDRAQELCPEPGALACQTTSQIPHFPTSEIPHPLSWRAVWKTRMT